MGEYLHEILDNVSQGIIVIDNKGIITTYNKKAKEIFGIFESSKIRHKSGIIQKGDFVFIADNKMGEDDGGLNSKDLQKIGIFDNSITTGDSILAFGVYKGQNNKKNAKYIVSKSNEEMNNMYLQGVYKDITYTLSINFQEKILGIEINGIKYNMEYRYAVGHMVIIRNGTLIFYQSKGYTARGENLKYILDEKPFEEKGANAKVLNPIGKFIFDVHEKNVEMNRFYLCATSEDHTIVNEFMNINGIATLSSILPLSIGENKGGAILRVEDITELKEVIEERNVLLKNLRETEELLRDENILRSFKNFQGISKHINNVKKIAYKSSKTDSTVLILGESGIGKSTLAEEIHLLSPRKNNKFLHINCASLPENLLESELFGYEGGAFTNSKKSGKMGLLQLAHGGTVFLDEIGEMSLKTQAKLLNFLQSKTFYKVGGVDEIQVDTRIICATNKNLEEAIQQGRFREDLYYRINVIPIYIEPLRNRVEDIPILVEKLIPKICNRLRREDIIITSEAMNKLSKYSWTGNVRELENILERAISLSDSNIIYSKNIIFDNKDMKEENTKGSLKENLEQAEKDIIIKSLRINQGSVKKVMEELNIGKTTFYEKVKKYNLKLESYK